VELEVAATIIHVILIVYPVTSLQLLHVIGVLKYQALDQEWELPEFMVMEAQLIF
jgi:uncharacterized membrane protein YsdA (DUF1294 family)